MPTLSPDPQYTPREFAHGSIAGLKSNIPRICGYKSPVPLIQQFSPGYFGPAQTRPELDGTVTPTFASGGTGTASTNQGQPSIGASVPFGSLIFWANDDGPTGQQGFAVRIDETGTGYGKKPALTEVIVTGGVF